MKRFGIFLATVLIFAITGCGDAGAKKEIASTVPSASAVAEPTVTPSEEPVIRRENQELTDFLEEKYGPDMRDFAVDLEPNFFGTTRLESEHFIWDIYEDASVTEEQIELAEKAIDVIETVSGMQFFGCKYIPDRKVTIHLESMAGSYSADGFEKSVYIDETAFTSEYGSFIHELYHVLQGGYVYDYCYPFIMEGHAEFWKNKTIQYIIDNQIEDLCELVSTEGYYEMYYEEMGALPLSDIETKELIEWMDQGCYLAFADSWPAYIYGRVFFEYLDAKGLDVNLWYLAAAKIPYAIQGYDEEVRKYMDNEQMLEMLCDVYGEDVIEGFYPWVKENADYLKEKGFR